MRRRDDEKEQRIKDAVVTLILKEGIDGASISRIAKMAEVSPATVYIYFDNKEDMLTNIYQEYSGAVYGYLLDCITPGLDGAQLIDTLMRGYYTYMTEHQEVFSFVEQCSHCPTFAGSCTEQISCHMFTTIHEMKRRHIIRNYSDENLMSVLFYPVKAIAIDDHTSEAARQERLEELIKIVQNALLT